MIGFNAILDELAFVLVPWGIFFVGLFVVMRSRTATKSEEKGEETENFPSRGTPKGSRSFRGAVLLWIFLLGILTYPTWRFVRQIQGRVFLAKLEAQDIDTISIGDSSITESKGKEALVKTLSNLQWFTPEHGGLAQEVPFLIRMRSGDTRAFRMAYYLRSEGAVILLTSPDGRRHYGYSFSASLPEVLKELGINLPHNRTN